ncbi:MAG: hypothetical protein HN804_09680 [Oceanospirillaceae bacterium]|nr:hypothetical protein [Oceanospirillaceae bacterium]
MTSEQIKLAGSAKFSIEFMAMMQMAGREEEATQAYNKAVKALADLLDSNEQYGDDNET